MIPTTTVAAPNFTGSAMQTATAGSVATGSTASYSGSVTQHEVSPQLPRIESFLGQPLQWRSVSASSPFAPSEPLINDADAPLQNQLLDERERAMATIQELEKEEELSNELNKVRNELARLVHESAEQTSSIQGLKKTLEDKSRELMVSQDNAKKAIEEFNKIKSTLESISERSESAKAKDKIKELKKQKKNMERKLEQSESEVNKEKAKTLKLETLIKKQNEATQMLNGELMGAFKTEYTAQKQLRESLQKALHNLTESTIETGNLKSELIASEEKFQKITAGIASAIGCSEVISSADLIGKVNALKQELDLSKSVNASLSAECAVIKDSERRLFAENLKKAEELKNLRHSLESAEATLRRCEQPLKDRVAAVHADHGYAKTEAEQKAIESLLLFSRQSSAGTAPEQGTTSKP